MSDAIDPLPQKVGPHRWQRGESGNLAGKPKGSRTMLREAFFTDLLADWESHGKSAIETFRAERPHDYVKVVASILPKEVNVKVNELEELSDAQISAQLNALARELRASGLDPFAGNEEAPRPEQAGPLSSLQ